jgi:hypothetical protein
MKGTLMQDNQLGFDVELITEIEELEAKKAPSVTFKTNTIAWDSGL